MARQDRLSSLISRFGRPITILRNAGNISDKCFLTENEPTSEYRRDGYFSWDSQIIDGDIFQDTLTEEYYIVVNCNYFGENGIKDGKKTLVYRSNIFFTLYSLKEDIETPYGGKAYNWMVKLNDYGNISYYKKGDELTPVGEMGFDQMLIIFSGRNLQGYVPQTGDRLVLQDQRKLQIDGIDPYLYSGCYDVACSSDQRL